MALAKIPRETWYIFKQLSLQSTNISIYYFTLYVRDSIPNYINNVGPHYMFTFYNSKTVYKNTPKQFTNETECFRNIFLDLH